MLNVRLLWTTQFQFFGSLESVLDEGRDKQPSCAALFIRACVLYRKMAILNSQPATASLRMLTVGVGITKMSG